MKMLTAFLFGLGSAVGCGGETDGARAGGAPVGDTELSRAGGFVAIGVHDLAFSADGTRWERRAFDLRMTPARVASAHGRVVVIGTAQSAAAAQLVAVTSDLRSWRSKELATGDCSLSDVAVIGGKFVVVGGGWERGSCAYESSDGETWRAITGAPTNAMFHTLVRDSDEIIASASYRSDMMTPMVFLKSGEGFRVIGEGDRSRPGLVSGAALGDGRIVLVDGRHEVHSWDDRSTYAPSVDGKGTDGASWIEIAHGGGKIVVVGTTNERGSVDSVVGARDETRGATLDITLRRTGGGLSAVAHGSGRFVVVGGASIAHSTDGATWTEASAPTGSLIDVSAIPRE